MMDNGPNQQDRNNVNRTSNETMNPGCGCDEHEVSTINLSISPTTGGQFPIPVQKTDTVEQVKKIISKKLKVPKERIVLLYRDRQLTSGSVESNSLMEGSNLRLLPAVETGLTTQKPEISVMNALESLNESQVNNFLSGKAPLNLTMRLGDHMMLIQLMLSTFSNQNQTPKVEEISNNTATTSNTLKTITSAGEITTNRAVASTSAGVSQQAAKVVSVSPAAAATLLSASSTNSKSDLSSTSLAAATKRQNIASTTSDTGDDAPSVKRIKESVSTVVIPCSAALSGSSKTACSSSTCVCSPSSSTSSVTNNSSSSTSVASHVVPPVESSVPLAKATRNLTQTLQKLSSEVLTSKRGSSSHSYRSGGGDSTMQINRKPNAILENMEHHGRGIYSGTFSGTLNPALQDRFGRPKKDVSTIIHILNDLLCAEPRTARCKPACNCASNNATGDVATSVAGDSAKLRTPTTNGELNCDTASNLKSTTLRKDPNVVTSFTKMNENRTTRSKMEQLKSLMVVRKEKRKEKKFNNQFDKQISAVDVISSATVNPGEPWTTTPVDPSTAADPTDPSSIHSTKAVIA